MTDHGELLARSDLDVADVPFARILRAVAAERRTLAARFRSGLVEKIVVFEEGAPVDCRSNMVQDTLSRFMVRRGRLSREQETGLLQQAAREERLFGEVVREAGLATAEEVYRLLQQNLATKLLDLFTWEDGTVELFDDPPQVSAPLKVNVPQLVLTGCTRFVPKSEVDGGVGHLVGQRILRHPAPPVDPESLHLSSSQREILAVLREPSGLTDLTSATEAGFEDATRFVYALIVLDLVIPEEELETVEPKSESPAEAREPTAATTTPEPPSASEPDSDRDLDASTPPKAEEEMDLARTAEDVMNTFLRHRRVDARTLLGVASRATPEDLEEAFLAYSRRFAPWQFEAPRLRPLADKARSLWFAGLRAFRDLGGLGGEHDAERRGASAEATKGGKRGAPVSSGRMIRRAADELAPLATELLDPETHFRKGLELREEGEYTKALDTLELAAKCDPQNGIYAAEAAWCFYQRSPGTGARKAREQLDRALRVDPRCGLAHYYYGELSRILGDYDVAEEHLRKAIKPMAPDRRPIDKLRDLARIRKQEEA